MVLFEEDVESSLLISMPISAKGAQPEILQGTPASAMQRVAMRTEWIIGAKRKIAPKRVLEISQAVTRDGLRVGMYCARDRGINLRLGLNDPSLRVGIARDVERMSVGTMMLEPKVMKLKITSANEPRRPMLPRAS